jgi:hypothetical protein
MEGVVPRCIDCRWMPQCYGCWVACVWHIICSGFGAFFFLFLSVSDSCRNVWNVGAGDRAESLNIGSNHGFVAKFRRKVPFVFRWGTEFLIVFFPAVRLLEFTHCLRFFDMMPLEVST